MCTLSDESKSPSGVPLHVKFVLEWDRPAQTQVINDETDQIEEHSSVKQVNFPFINMCTIQKSRLSQIKKIPCENIKMHCFIFASVFFILYQQLTFKNGVVSNFLFEL